MTATTTTTTPPSATNLARDTRLRRLALSGFQAACEALYPENDFGAPSWRDTDMVARAAELWDELPPESRLTLELLYATLELGGAALVPSLGPLSSIPVAARYRMLDRCRRSRIWPLRFIAEAVKSSSTMVYMSHPTVMQYIGVSKACGHPADRHLDLPVRSNAFSGLIAPQPSPGKAAS